LRLAEEDGVAPLATEGKLYLTEENGSSIARRSMVMLTVVAQVVVAFVVAIAVEGKIVAAVVMALAHRVGAAIAIDVASRGTGLRIVTVSSPRKRRKNMPLRPKKRSPLSCSSSTISLRCQI
jgi:hypothetical protein